MKRYLREMINISSDRLDTENEDLSEVTLSFLAWITEYILMSALISRK